MICPKCGKRIEYVVAERIVPIYQEVYFDEDNKVLDWEDEFDRGEDEKVTFYCPECNEKITNSQEKIIELFKNEEKKK
ncbi:MAG: hypothetical protein QW478_04905 [Candidatus Micrarchaeaceae archaeon]